MKPVRPRLVARRDVTDIIDRYLGEATPQVAGRFIDELERVYLAIARQPGTGSPRYAHDLNLDSLRVFRLKRFPYLVFYVDAGDHIDVWRVLHARRDIPGALQEAAS